MRTIKVFAENLPMTMHGAGQSYNSGRLDGTGTELTVEGATYGGRGTRFTVHFSDADCVHRDEYQGPVSQRASAFLTPQATVISAHPMPRDKVIGVKVGDKLALMVEDEGGLTNVAVVEVTPEPRWGYPGLKVLVCDPPTADYSEWVAEYNAKPKREVSESYLSG